MTSHPSVGNRRPPLPASSSSFPRPPSRTVSHASPRIPRSASQQVVIDLTDATASSSSRDTSGPAYKKQRLDDGTSSGGARSPLLPDGELVRQASQRSIVGSPASLNTNATSLNSPSVQDPRYAGDRSRPALPFPVRPGRYAPRTGKRPSFDKAGTRGDVRAKPYVLSVPAPAPQYSADRPADFFPWTGDHPEDILSEQATKTGFYDKTQVSQNETSTARPSIWSSLKHKSGLQILSSLFVSALDQRQAHGTVTANSTFKPPPRVTLTDTKREAWLRDLADPATPLRRLSRTIPHGIRGKVLLDHCLHKEIPTGRAVWLAKCVGANEIRAFKRKGTSGAFAVGGEAKWIREWTSHVEQFVEYIIDSCGAVNWKDMINYALRLSSHLFSEHLLDQDHYLDWMISALYSSDLNTVPIWLLVTQIYWKEILQYRRRGRRLAEALLEQLQRMKASTHENEELFPQMQEQLARLLKSFIIENPACFILPGSWVKYGPLLISFLGDEDANLILSFERLSGRNLRLIRSRDKQSHRPTKDSRPRLINLLDSIPMTFQLHQTSEECLQTMGNKELLIRTVLEWASSLYRKGQARIYVAVRLLRRWAKTGIDVGGSILAFLAASPTMVGLQKSNVYRIIVELVRSKHFSVGKYLQWLVARGSLRGRQALGPDDPCDVRLLCELPLHGLPGHVLNLRRILLASVGYSVVEEEATIDTAKRNIAEQIPGLFSRSEPSFQITLPSLDLRRLGGTVKWDLGRWVRQGVASRFQADRTSSEADIKETVLADSSESVITLQQLAKIRKILEDLEDFTILADVLSIVSECEDARILNLAVDTVNQYVDVFAAIGAADDLFGSVCQRHEEIRAQMPVMKSLIVSLIDLGEALPNQTLPVRQLRKVVLSYERKCAIAACSPVSDHMAEALQSTESNFADEFEQVLASGSSMDKQTLSRLFETAMNRMGPSKDESLSAINLPELLFRLRSFDTKAFDELMQGWLDSLLQSTSRPRLLDILPTLISGGCTTLRAVVDQASILIEGPSKIRHCGKVATDMLELLCSNAPVDPLSTEYQSLAQPSQRAYRFRKEQDLFNRTHPSQLLMIIRATIRACADPQSSAQASARALISSTDGRGLLRDLMVRHPESLDELGQAFSPGASVDQVKLAIHQLVDPGSQQGVLPEDIDGQISTIMRVANDLNLPFCQLKLKFTLISPDPGMGGPSQDSVVPTLMEAIKSSIALAAVARRHTPASTVWTEVISVLDRSHATKLRETAENELLSNLMTTTSAALPCLEQNKATLEGLLAVIDATHYSIPGSGDSQLLAHVVEKLDSVASSFSSAASEAKHPGLGESALGARQQRLGIMYLNIDVLLRLIILHQSTFFQPKSSHSNTSRLLLTLSSLLVHHQLTHNPTLSTHIFDVLALLSDYLSDDSRVTCFRILADQCESSDPRLRFLFACSDGGDGEGLQLMSTSSSPTPSITSEPKKEGGKTTTQQPFPFRRWEMMQEATPIVGENDTSLSLGLFGARKAVLQL